jgi:hypothetical protein
MVPLGLASGDRDTARDLVQLLKTNGIPFSGGGSRAYAIEVPVNKLQLALNLLRTNQLVLEGRFVLYTNDPINSYRP